MTIKHVNWDNFQLLIEDCLRTSDLPDLIPSDTFSKIREVIIDNLEIYVEKKFLSQFHIDTRMKRGVISIDLRHDQEIICKWEIHVEYK